MRADTTIFHSTTSSTPTMALVFAAPCQTGWAEPDSGCAGLVGSRGADGTVLEIIRDLRTPP